MLVKLLARLCTNGPAYPNSSYPKTSDKSPLNNTLPARGAPPNGVPRVTTLDILLVS